MPSAALGNGFFANVAQTQPLATKAVLHSGGAFGSGKKGTGDVAQIGSAWRGARYASKFVGSWIYGGKPEFRHRHCSCGYLRLQHRSHTV